ncbi:aminopeptidase N [Aquisalimonas sp.]|uniref:aminopeptidase N n=1 Tax=Aquisalimonas sp. TaxID=1872621 RepID=UPI0025BD93FF|nr:aminopeptidase N [Aquisalimonas sp.]
MLVSAPRVQRDDYRPPAFLVDHVALTFDLDPRATRVHSELWLRRNPDSPLPEAALRLDGEQLHLDGLSLDDQPLPDDAWSHDAASLTIYNVPDRFSLETEVVLNPAANTALMGLYQAGPILCTQCEPEAFRRITFFPDRPDILSRFRVTLRGDAVRYPVMLANGNPVDRVMLPDGRAQVVWYDPHPKPCYLFALVAGELQKAESAFTTASGRSVSIGLYAEPHNIHCCDHALATIRRAMAWDESRYGREYDLDVLNLVAVSAYTMGAMENKGLNIFNDRYVLADPGCATDADLRAIEALVAHEYFHNWTGNRVTCRDWFQLGLKEGLTVFREQQFVADQGWGDVRRIEDARLMRTRQFAEDAGPLAHPVRPQAYREIENFFTDTVYSKGAELVRMVATLLGARRFRAGMDRFFQLYDGEAVTVEDFIACMAAAADRDLDQFLQWYDQRGTPELRITAVHEREQARYGLRVEQLLPEGVAPLHMPLAVGFLDEGGRELPVQLHADAAPGPTTRVLELGERQQTFWFSGVAAPPIPALLRGFSAPVRVHFRYSDAELRQLAVRDPDALARWDAVQRLVHRAVDRRLRGEDALPAALVTVFGQLLREHTASPGVIAEMLTLPNESTLATELGAVDFDALVAARDWLVRQINSHLGVQLLATYHACAQPPDGGQEPVAVGRRALKNVCLGIVVAGGAAHAIALCHDQYAAGPTTTDRLAALASLTDTEAPVRDEALSDFQRRCWHDPLMVDKWFAIQARSRRADTLEQVLALMDNPAYAIHQPNRVRSLIEVFCADNPAQFHRADGAGYRLLADQVCCIDPVNPPLAAGLARYLSPGGWMRADRRRLLGRELERIRAIPSLSEGTREVVFAALDEV